MNDTVPEPHAEVLEDLTPSCVIAYRTLQEFDRPAGTVEIAEASYCNHRTIYGALDTLESEGLVETWGDPTEPRGNVHEIADI